MNKKRISLISDTHGLLRPEAIQALAGADLIIHAGDVGNPDILRQLDPIAKVVAVRGNVDRGEWANELPVTRLIEFDGLKIYVIHDIKHMDMNPAAAGINLVVHGHSHHPLERRENGIIYINPGSAGPRRFKLPIGMAVIKKNGDRIEVEFMKW